LEAFSDGVIAILITIMVLELRPPHGADFSALRETLPAFLAYVLSFVYLGIYWNNHHHMLHVTRRVTGGILWANLHLLFWLSLVPFVTAWMGDQHNAKEPTALYGVVMVFAAMAYTLLQRTIIAHQADGAQLAKAIGGDLKGKISILLYVLSIPIALAGYVRIADSLFVAVALTWLVPDRRIENRAVELSS
jgi:uncharacterized membrane protein